MASENSDSRVNRLLTALPQEDYERLRPHLQLVQLPQKKILYAAGDDYSHAYFPCSSMISTVAIMESGATTEIGIEGSEGMCGLPILLGSDYTSTTAIVQVGGEAWRVSARILKAEYERGGAIRSLLSRYIQARFIQLGQTAACNRHHSVEQRFTRWLLVVRDGIQKDEFALTQEFISQMLGVRRAGISEIAAEFQKHGIIKYQRGYITITDPEKLTAAACECYSLVTNEFNRLLGTKNFNK